MKFLYFVTYKSTWSVLHFEWIFLIMYEFVTYLLVIWKRKVHWIIHIILIWWFHYIIIYIKRPNLLIPFSSGKPFIIGKLQILVFQSSEFHLKAQTVLLATNTIVSFVEVISTRFSLLTKLLPNTQLCTVCMSIIKWNFCTTKKVAISACNSSNHTSVFPLRQPSYFDRQQKWFMHNFHFITQNIKNDIFQVEI